jgi:beta-barrel assembly-enhancing protease
MRRAVPYIVAAAVATACYLPRTAHAGFGQPKPAAPKTETTEARAPIPPGIATSVENAHLPTEAEVRLGRETAEKVEQHYKIISSGPYNDRLQRVAKDVVLAINRKDIIQEYRKRYNAPRSGDKSRRVPFEWSFKVVDTTKEVNAFALAGGYVYVTKGLMDYAPSDHELAAVLAHECAHALYHHVDQMVKRQNKMSKAQILALIATIIAGAAGGGQAAAAASNIVLGAQLVAIATLTGYSQELETEADYVGVMALSGTDYNPVAMMTFMQKLQRDERIKSAFDAGIYRTHPYSNERVAAIKKQVESLGYATDTGTQRMVNGAFRVTTEENRVGGKPVVDVKLNGNLLLTVASAEGQLTPYERANKIASQLETLFGDNLTYNDLRKSMDKTTLLLKGVPVIKAYPEDAAAMNSTPESVIERASNQIHRALLNEQINKPF